MDERAASTVRTAAGRRGAEGGEDLCLGALESGEHGALELIWQQV